MASARAAPTARQPVPVCVKRQRRREPAVTLRQTRRSRQVFSLARFFLSFPSSPLRLPHWTAEDVQEDKEPQGSASRIDAPVGDKVDTGGTTRTASTSHEPRTQDSARLLGRLQRLRMRKPKVIRMVFALSLGCFIMVILYFNSSLKPGEQKVFCHLHSRS